MVSKKVKLLDCTLRDGGFVNDWNFGEECILSIFKKLDTANIDVIEVGFLDERQPYSKDRTINPDTDSYNKIFSKISKNNAIAVGMIDYGTCPIENIQDKENSFLDGIRVIFKKNNADSALSFCKQIINKGYKVFVQPVSVTSYTNIEWVNLIQKINEINPYSMSIVDTYGLLHKNHLINYFNLADAMLDEKIRIGYHSHNNFQLAYSNSIELIELNTTREILLDASVYGMGKGAGNANLELIAMYMNEKLNKNYNINHILEIVDTHIIKLFHQYGWGYSMQFYLAASNDCHPQYVKYLTEKKTLDIKSVNEILGTIEKEKKLSFNESHIEKLYIKYQQKDVKDEEDCKKIIEEFANRKLLLLGPANSIIEEKSKIDEFINKENPIIISINFIDENINSDFVFISNKKRYKEIKDSIMKFDELKTILTSNILVDKKNEFIINYETLLCEDHLVMDNSLLMFLNFLLKIDIKKVYLAGFDGFTGKKEDYADEAMRFSVDNNLIECRNNAISSNLKKLNEEIKIEFVTNTKYVI